MRNFATTATIIIGLTLTACSGGSGGGVKTPTSPELSQSVTSCSNGCDGVIRPPAQGEVDAAIRSVRDTVRQAVADGRLKAKKSPNWEALPAVEWRACYFWVDNASWVDSSGKQVSGGACAAGLTDFNNRKIVVSTAEQERTIRLVRWETANYYLVAIGRNDLTDSWQVGNV